MQPNFELIREMAAIIDGIPDKRFDLDRLADNTTGGDMSDPHHCGTIACAIGYTAMHPRFKALGLGLDGQGRVWLGEQPVYFQGAAILIFGLNWNEANNIFGQVGESKYDRCDDYSHKSTLRNRVRMFLEEYGQPVNTEYQP